MKFWPLRADDRPYLICLWATALLLGPLVTVGSAQDPYSILFTISVPAGSVRFPGDLALMPDGTIAVADSGVSQRAQEAGVVRMFSGADGQLLRTLGNPNPAFVAQFGVAMAPFGNDLIVGAPFDSHPAANRANTTAICTL